MQHSITEPQRPVCRHYVYHSLNSRDVGPQSSALASISQPPSSPPSCWHLLPLQLSLPLSHDVALVFRVDRSTLYEGSSIPNGVFGPLENVDGRIQDLEACQRAVSNRSLYPNTAYTPRLSDVYRRNDTRNSAHFVHRLRGLHWDCLGPGAASVQTERHRLTPSVDGLHSRASDILKPL